MTCNTDLAKILMSGQLLSLPPFATPPLTRRAVVLALSFFTGGLI